MQILSTITALRFMGENTSKAQNILPFSREETVRQILWLKTELLNLAMAQNTQ